MPKKNIYFPGLNGIRAIAASIVLLFHTDQFTRLFGVDAIGFYGTGMAGYGVVLFFCLSGFLITYLLLAEKTQFQKVDLKKFYVRRILRIWPLYYLAILLGVVMVFMLDNIEYKNDALFTTVGLFTFLLSNVAYVLNLKLTPITPLWSVSVEEQFYAFWPFLINKSKKIILSLIGIIILFLAFKLGSYLSGSGAYYFFHHSAFDTMAVGGIGAYVVFKRHKVLSVLYNPVLQLISWAWLIISCLDKPISIWQPIDFEIHSLFYTAIIINVSTNPKTIFSLENKAFNFIGKISYGIYVYHMIIICCISFLLKSFILSVDNTFVQRLLIFSSVVLSTLIIAFLSFKYFESRFLKLKSGYSKIHSTNEAPVKERKYVKERRAKESELV